MPPEDEMQVMTASDMITQLQKLDADSAVLIKDLNGCYWILEPHHIVCDLDGDIIIDTQGINSTTNPSYGVISPQLKKLVQQSGKK
jgi:hypothetical protein